MYAEIIKKICSVENQSLSMEDFLACWLIPLDKYLGLRSFGIGVILYCTAAKVVVTSMRADMWCVSQAGTKRLKMAFTLLAEKPF